jgi:predicted nucleic acid-binding protein
MKDKVFLDSNILVYSQRSDDLKKRDISIKLIKGKNFMISTQSISELCNVLTKKFKIDTDKIF